MLGRLVPDRHAKIFYGRSKATLHDLVAIVSGRFQRGAVEHGDVPPNSDDPGPLQGAGNDAHARPVNTQHERKKLLRYLELVTLGAVMCHEQPAGKALLQIMTAVARRRLRRL